MSKPIDMLLLRRSRLSPLEQVIAIVIATGLVMLAAGLVNRATHHPKPQPHHAPSVFDYPVQPPGFTVSQHMPADAKAEVATLARYYLGPSGANLTCKAHWYYLIPYQTCTILFQPGTTRAISTWLKAQQGTNAVLAVSLIVGTAVAVCVQMGLAAVSYVCGAFGAWFGQHLVSVFNDASRYQMCARFDWNYFPSPNALLSIQSHQPPVSFSAAKYGRWEEWKIVTRYHNGQWDNYWVFGYTTSCIMPRDCTDIPTPIGAGCIV